MTSCMCIYICAHIFHIHTHSITTNIQLICKHVHTYTCTYMYSIHTHYDNTFNRTTREVFIGTDGVLVTELPSDATGSGGGGMSSAESVS